MISKINSQSFKHINYSYSLIIIYRLYSCTISCHLCDFIGVVTDTNGLKSELTIAEITDSIVHDDGYDEELFNNNNEDGRIKWSLC